MSNKTHRWLLCVLPLLAMFISFNLYIKNKASAINNHAAGDDSASSSFPTVNNGNPKQAIDVTDEEAGRALRLDLMLPDDDPRKQRAVLREKLNQFPESIRARYSDLIKQLELSDEIAVKFLNLMVARELLMTQVRDQYKKPVYVDVVTQSDYFGANPGQVRLPADLADARQVIAAWDEVLSPINAAVAQLLGGSDRFDLYNAYNDQAQFKGRVNGWNNRFDAYGIPLMDAAQSETIMLAVTAANTPLKNLININVITDEVMATAAAVLSPEQLSALERIRQVDEARQRAVDGAIQTGQYKSN
jgi:hypothetical protein